MPRTRNEIFDRVSVDYAIRGTARVSWELRRRFTDPEPHTFQLQVSRNGGDTFTNVGVAFAGACFANDDTQRLFGKDMRAVYRVQLTTPLATYTSLNAQILGDLSRRQWLIAREIIRKNVLQTRQRGLTSFNGTLLKRKVEGTLCPNCLDLLTGDITDTSCTTCDGTRFVDGYWTAGTNIVLDISPEMRSTKIGDRLARGTVNDQVVSAKFIGIPLINRRDVWVDAVSDRRYFIWRVQNQAEINQVPIIVACEMKVLPYTDVIYGINVS